MVSGFSTSPYDHDRMVLGEARLIRSAVSPLVSTGSSPQKICASKHKILIDRACLVPVYNSLDSETNKGKRFESFSQALAIFLLVFISNALIIRRWKGRVKPI